MVVVAALVSDEPLEPLLPEDDPLEPEDDPLDDESELPEEEEELPPEAVLDDESHFGAASSSVFGCDETSSACFGGPPQAASASPMATKKPISFQVRMPMGLARFHGGQHSTSWQLPHSSCDTTASFGMR